MHLTHEALLTLAVLLGTTGAMIFTRWATDVILAGGLTIVLIAGIIPPETALMGFSNPGMMAIAVLYIVAAGLVETGAADRVGRWIMGKGGSLRLSLLRFLPGVTLSSAFVNNTPIVAMLVPALEKWCREKNIEASKVMIPLSYAAILGGTCTLMGTSTNLLIDGLIQQHSHSPAMGFFEISKVGVPVAIACLIATTLLAPHLLPKRLPAISVSSGRKYTMELSVEANSPVIGKSIEDAGLRHLGSAFLAEVRRGANIITAVSPHEILQEDDRLIFVGQLDSVLDLTKTKGLKARDSDKGQMALHKPQRCIVEAVVSPLSPLVGIRLKDTQFRKRYSAVVIAAGRGGQALPGKLGDLVLQPGDLLLMEARPSFLQQQRQGEDFMIINSLQTPTRPPKKESFLSMGILLLMVILVSTGTLDLLKGALLAAGLMLITRCTNANSARRAVDLSVIISIAAAIGLAEAISASGLAHELAHYSLSLCGDSPSFFLAMTYLLTLTLTLLLTNNAAAVLMFPLAYSGAQDLGISFQPVAMTIMMAASASFATPIGYQTNLMVMGPGGYRFNDYLKLGIPLTLIHGLISLWLIPQIWVF